MPTALIVEDEPEANRLLALLLQLKGYRTECARDGAEAWQILARCRPDVIFLDLMLPDTNGYEICRRLKAQPETTLIPVVIVSARLAEENRTRCFQHGALAYVAKPYTPDILFRALGEAEQWQRDLEARPDFGATFLEPNVEIMGRELGRLRSLLVAHSALSNSAIGAVASALRSIWQGAAAWSARTEADPVARLEYRVGPHELTARITDLSGWFSGGDLTEASAGFEPSLHDVFDLVDRDGHEGAVVLVRKFEGTGGARDA